MKGYAFFFLSIIIGFFLSCSSNIDRLLEKAEDLIYTGQYNQAEEILLRVDPGEHENRFLNQYKLVKGYLKCEQGYWGMAGTILENTEPFDNPRLTAMGEILEGFLHLYTGDINKALLNAKSVHRMCIDEETGVLLLQETHYRRVLFLLYRLFLESYHKAENPVLYQHFRDEFYGICKEYSIPGSEYFFLYYDSIIKDDEDSRALLMDKAENTSLPLVWRIRYGLFALQSGVTAHRYDSVTPEMEDLYELADTHRHSLDITRYNYFFGCIEKEGKRWDKAVHYFSLSLRGYESLQHTASYYISLYQYGISLYHQNRYVESLQSLVKAEEYYRESGQDELYAELAGYLGSLYKIVGHFKLSDTNFRAAYDFYRDKMETDKDKVIECLMNLGVISTVQLEYSTALAYFNDILSFIDPPAGNESIQHATLYNNRGQIYKQMESYDLALSEFMKGLDYAAPDSEICARILLNMADCYYRLGREDEAFVSLDKASLITRAHEYMKLRGEIFYFQARIELDKKEYDHAEEFLKGSLVVFNRIGDLKYKAKALYSLSVVYRNKGENKQAIESLEEAAEIFDTIGLTLVGEGTKTEFRKEYGFVLQDIIILLVGEEDYKKAFYFVEKTKARNLLENLSENDFNVSSLIPAELAQKRQDLIYLKNNLSQHYFAGISTPASVIEEIVRIDRERAVIERHIALAVPEAYALEGAAVLSPEIIMAGLDHNDILLEFEIVGNSLYLFLVTAQDIYCHVLGPRDSEVDYYLSRGDVSSEIESLAYHYQNMLTDYSSSESEIKTTGKQLFEKLLTPVFDMAREKKNWIIVPDKKLFYLPFAALVKPDNTYLVQTDLQISYSHSAVMYVKQKTKKKPEAIQPFLFFGLPDDFLFSTWKQDAFDIRDSYSSSTYYFYDDARESTLRTMDLTPYKTIQFLLHGFTYDTFDHLNSNGLVFYENDREGYDGLLTLEEIFNLKMNPDLLVLTACSSGLGKQIDGEGLYGMNHAFFYAGARSILSTLWNVYIIETNRFSILLSRNNASGSLSPKEAVIKAQEQLFKEYPHPVYWAPFVLFGYGG